VILAVCGNPVLHSKSPLIFNHYFKQNGIDGVYTRIAAESAEEIVEFIRSSGIRGCNVTAPFKEKVIAHLDNVDNEAARLQSVNTIVNNNGVLTGYSTDSYGVTYSLQKICGDCSGKQALLLGAGGAGRAAAFALARLGLKVTVVNRTYEKAVAAAELCGGTACRIEECERAVRGADVVVNTMLADVNIVQSQWFKPGTVALDAIYQQSVFRREALKADVTLIPGEEWLYYQADRAAEHFFGKRFCSDTVPAEILQSRSSFHETVALIGYMGSGKSTIAQSLSDLMQIPYFEMDTILEEQEGMSISSIFEKKGENYFRDKESLLLKSITVMPGKKIISCGGGVVVRDENLKCLKESALSVWIYADMVQSLERIADTDRPLAAGGEEKFTALFESRKKLYAECADITVINSEKDANISSRRIYEEICDQINS
jgi:shikimate dehydrogenase